jgi:hypothetical protein
MQINKVLNYMTSKNIHTNQLKVMELNEKVIKL